MLRSVPRWSVVRWVSRVAPRPWPHGSWLPAAPTLRSRRWQPFVCNVRMSDFDCGAAAGILAAGQTLARVANAAAIVAGVACWLARGPTLFLLGLSVLLWLVQTWFAARVAIDRSLFAGARRRS